MFTFFYGQTYFATPFLLLLRSEKQVSSVQAENKKLTEPLKKAKEELHRLKGKTILSELLHFFSQSHPNILLKIK